MRKFTHAAVPDALTVSLRLPAAGSDSAAAAREL